MPKQKNKLKNRKCLICEGHVNKLLSCKCSICQDCYFEWITTRNNDSLNRPEVFLQCPNKSCGEESTLHSALACFTPSQTEKLNSILFQKYLNTTYEIRKCPKETCSFAGFFEKHKKCYEGFKCDNCFKEWKDVDSCSLSLSQKFGYFCSNNLLNTASDIYIGLRYRVCPHCYVNYYKYEGCNHITCTHCKKESCYLCMGFYENHNVNACYAKRDTQDSIFFWLFILCALKFIFSISLIRNLICYCGYYIGYFAWFYGIYYGLGLFAYIVYFACLFFMLFSFVYFIFTPSLQCWFEKIIISSGFSITQAAVFLILYCKWDMFYQYTWVQIKFAIWTAIILACIIIAYFALHGCFLALRGMTRLVQRRLKNLKSK